LVWLALLILMQIRILQQLKERIERETGQKLPSGPDEVLPPIAGGCVCTAFFEVVIL
jgi:hypothetical protein